MAKSSSERNRSTNEVHFVKWKCNCTKTALKKYF